MIQIKKAPHGGIAVSGELHLLLDAAKSQLGDSIAIITEPGRGRNQDATINLPGEYELRGVVVRGYDGPRYTFVIRDGLTVLYAPTQPSAALLSEVRERFGEVACVVAPALRETGSIAAALNPSVWVTWEQPTKVENLKVERVSAVSLNPKRLTAANYFLS